MRRREDRLKKAPCVPLAPVIKTHSRRTTRAAETSFRAACSDLPAASIPTSCRPPRPECPLRVLFIGSYIGGTFL